jgi:putative transposase
MARGAGTRACRDGTPAVADLLKRTSLLETHFPDMSETRRRLPHIYPEGKWLFATWHLHGSLPHDRYPPPGLRAGEAFVWMDRYLDTTRTGPLYLRREDIARIVATSLRPGVELGHYDLRAWVVMANHVHALLLPKVPAARLLGALKGCTAREANQVLGRTGQPFWQAESYDHWVRDEREFEKIVAYIENNPVKAGLVARAEDYSWSSAASPSAAKPVARDGKSPVAAGTSAYATPTSREPIHIPHA